MEGRCVVETWAQFGCRSSTCMAKVLSMGTDVLLCACNDEVHVFNKQEKKLMASFPAYSLNFTLVWMYPPWVINRICVILTVR